MKSQKGFTLFELLIAIVIIGAIAGLVLDYVKDNKEELKEGVANIKEIAGVVSENSPVKITVTTSTDKEQKIETVQGTPTIDCQLVDDEGRAIVYINKTKFFYGEKDSYGDIQMFPCYQLQGKIETGCENGESTLFIGNRKFFLGKDDGWRSLNPIPCQGG